MSAPTTPAADLSARDLARQRRRASFSRGWAEFRRHRAGMVGLVVMLLFVAVALGAG